MVNVVCRLRPNLGSIPGLTTQRFESPCWDWFLCFIFRMTLSIFEPGWKWMMLLLSTSLSLALYIWIYMTQNVTYTYIYIKHNLYFQHVLVGSGPNSSTRRHMSQPAARQAITVDRVKETSTATGASAWPRHPYFSGNMYIIHNIYIYINRIYVYIYIHIYV